MWANLLQWESPSTGIAQYGNRPVRESPSTGIVGIRTFNFYLLLT
jgi:hypothetical protein